MTFETTSLKKDIQVLYGMFNNINTGDAYMSQISERLESGRYYIEFQGEHAVFRNKINPTIGFSINVDKKSLEGIEAVRFAGGGYATGITSAIVDDDTLLLTSKSVYQIKLNIDEFLPRIENIEIEIENIETEIENIETDVESNKSNITSLQALVSIHSEDIDGHSTKISDLETTVEYHSNGISQLNAWLFGLQHEVATVKNTVDLHKTDIRDILLEMSSYSWRIANITGTVSIHATKIGNLQLESDTHNTKIGILQDRTASHTTQIEALQTNVDSLKTVTISHTTKISALETNFGSLSPKLNLIKYDGRRSGYTFPFIPTVHTDGAMEIGRYLDFHYDNSDSNDYTARMSVHQSGRLELTKPLAITCGESDTVGAGLWIQNNSSTTWSLDVHKDDVGNLHFKRMAWNGFELKAYIKPSGEYFQNSDRRLKDNIKEVSDEDAQCILKMNPVTYNFKDTGKRSIGLIAQEVEEVMKNTSLPSVAEEYCGQYGMDYTSLIPLLIKQIQILNKRIDALEGR